MGEVCVRAFSFSDFIGWWVDPVRVGVVAHGVSHMFFCKPGVRMGSRGPVPKRSEDRKRRNKTPGGSVKACGAARVNVPRGNSDWAAVAKRLYKGLRDSGQSRFFEPSDWAFAYFMMDEITRYTECGRQNGQVLSSLLSGLSSLLVTEGERRRVGMELTRSDSQPGDGEKNVLVMEQWRERMGG